MAEGIKISEMEQVTTLEDGCCFPVVSNGENKKITFSDLKSLFENYDGVKVFRKGINESTSGWELSKTILNANSNTYNFFRKKTYNVDNVINVCINNGSYTISNNKVTISVLVGSGVPSSVTGLPSSGITDVTCKGYIEYV